MRFSRCTKAKTSARSSVRHRDIVLARHLRRRRRKRRRTRSLRKKPTKKEKKAEKKEAKAPKDPKKDPISLDEYFKKLPSRGLAGSDIFTKKRTQKAWDVELIKLAGKLSASAIESSDEL